MNKIARFVLIANPGSNRVEFFQQALARRDLPPAAVIPWLDFLSGREHVGDHIAAGTILRIESPGRDFGVERALLAMGAEIEDDCPTAARLSRAECEALPEDKGRILYPRQWYLGFRRALETIADQCAACPPHRMMNAPDEIAVMFDKRLTHAAMKAQDIPVPRALGPVGSYAELTARMRDTDCRRVFVKLAHGSSASGVVALQTNGRDVRADTTVEMVETTGGLQLYNSRTIQIKRDEKQVARLIDALGPHGLHVEQWLPKAGMDGCAFDLRVVVIRGQARHTVARLSRSPMTNLHLLNKRGDSERVKERMGNDAWATAMASCERAMAACFPGSLYAGLDLLISLNFCDHALLEANAFGDLLPGILSNGEDTYGDEIDEGLREEART